MHCQQNIKLILSVTNILHLGMKDFILVYI